MNRFASLLDGLTSGHIDDPSFIPILERDLEGDRAVTPKAM